MNVLTFIAQYWLQWLLGIIALALGGIAKHFYSLYKKDKQRVKEDELTEIRKIIDAQIDKCKEDIMSQVYSIRDTTVESTMQHCDKVIKKLDNHEKDVQKNYQAMFDSLTLQINTIKQESEGQDNQFKDDLTVVHKGIDTLSKGMLSIQGREFKNNCRELLRKDHCITEEEYEEIIDDHDVYNSLGGNHLGDNLFELVKKKAAKDIGHDE